MSIKISVSLLPVGTGLLPVSNIRLKLVCTASESQQHHFLLVQAWKMTHFPSMPQCDGDLSINQIMRRRNIRQEVSSSPSSLQNKNMKVKMCSDAKLTLMLSSLIHRGRSHRAFTLKGLSFILLFL